MKALLVLAGVGLLCAAAPAYAAEEAACQQMFEKADVNKDGTVGGPEVANFAEPYKASIGGGQGADTELIITADQFKEACIKDAFKDVQMPQ
jgi:hypothetical protein